MTTISFDVPQKYVTGLTDQAAPWRKTRMRFRILGKEDYIDIPFAPRNITYDGFGSAWTQLDRPRRKPLLYRSNPKLLTIAFDLYIGPKDGNHADMTVLLKKFQNYADRGTHVLVYYNSSFEGSIWRLTQFSFESRTRDPDTNAIVEADAHFTFTEASDVTSSIGPTSGGVTPSTTTSSTSSTVSTWTPPATSTTTVRRYTVKSGDTLSKIAIAMYGDYTKWRAIATANNITRPDLIYPGQVLRIP